MPQEGLSQQALLAKVKGKRSVNDHKDAGKVTWKISDGIA